MQPSYPFDPYDWTTITPLFRTLIDTPVDDGGFDAWLEQWNQLDIAAYDAWTLLKQRSYANTVDADAELAYQVYTREMFSTYLGLTNALVACALTLQPEAPSPAHEQLWRRWRNQTTLFHPDSLPLQAEISELESSYREVMRHIEQLPGNANAHWLERRAEMDALMMRLLNLRRELARVSGLPTFLAYRWRELNRLDFSIEECQQFHRDAEEIVIPVLVKMRASAPPNPTHSGVTDVDLMRASVERMLDNVDPSFGSMFRAMGDGYLDLGTRPGKAHTSEQWFFPQAGLPYLHSSSTNLGTTLHESGHAAHAYFSFQAHGSLWNHVGPDEFQEFVAVALDMLCWPYYEQAQGGPYTHAESVATLRHDIVYVYLGTIAWAVMEDAFEHWVYGEAPEDVTPAQLDAKWLEIRRRFMPWEDTHTNEVEAMTGWQRWNWSLFRIPLYTIAYPIATIGTCLLGRQARNERAGVIANYKAAILLGNTATLPELFRVAGLSFPFKAQDVQDAVQFAQDEYERLAEAH